MKKTAPVSPEAPHIPLHRQRRAICAQCPHALKNQLCTLCGCLLAAKTRLKGSHCPLGKW